MTVAKKPSDLPQAKKHKLMAKKPSDLPQEDDEEPQNEPRTSSNSQPMVPLLPLHQGPAASSQGPAAIPNIEDEVSEYSDEYSAQSQDSGRTVLHPDLYNLTDNECWTGTPESHKYAAAGSFSFVITENGEQQDLCNLTTMPSAQRSLFLDGATTDSGSTQIEGCDRLWPNRLWPSLFSDFGQIRLWPNRLWPEKFDRLWPTSIDRLWPNRF